MREITQLADKVAEGTVEVPQLQKMLAFERKIANRVTLRTLGIFSHEYNQREQQAESILDESTQAAIRNIPIIERLLTQLGADINSLETQPVDTNRNYAREEKVDDGNGFGL